MARTRVAILMLAGSRSVTKRKKERIAVRRTIFLDSRPVRRLTVHRRLNSNKGTKSEIGIKKSGSFEQLVGKNDRTYRQIRSWFSGVFAYQKLQEFATGCVIRHMMSQLSFIIGTPKREQRATFVVDIVQDQLSWR